MNAAFGGSSMFAQMDRMMDRAFDDPLFDIGSVFSSPRMDRSLPLLGKRQGRIGEQLMQRIGKKNIQLEEGRETEDLRAENAALRAALAQVQDAENHDIPLDEAGTSGPVQVQTFTTIISHRSDGVRIVITSPNRRGFRSNSMKMLGDTLPVPVTAPFSGVFDPIAVPLHMGAQPLAKVPASRGDQFVHEVLGELGMRVGNRSAVHLFRVPGPPACAEDTRVHCAEAAEILHCLAQQNVSAGCAKALEESLPEVCSAVLDKCTDSAVLTCLQMYNAELEGPCATSYEATVAHIDAFRKGITAGLTVVNDETGKERPLACAEHEEQYYHLFDRFDDL